MLSTSIHLRHTSLALMAMVVFCAVAAPAVAEDSSAAPILQLFEAEWETIEERMPDIFMAGYGRMWVPPPQRADSGNQSVGYDVFDRFDLGRPRNRTLYGTENGLKSFIGQAHRAGIAVNTDFIMNHNGFSDNSTFDNQGTPADPSDDVTFTQGGGYPGFVHELPGFPAGDFHPLPPTDRFNERLAGLIDIDETMNHQFIRTPVDVGNPLNIPAGTHSIFGRPPANVPDPNNARFYPDQDLGGTTVWDPKLGQNVTLYDFNTSTPLAGDAVSENSIDLIMRSARWMIEEVGVDGFRLDAARHFPQWVLDRFDTATFLAKKEPLLDGSQQHPFTFIETGGDGDLNYLQGFIRKDIDNNNLAQVGGNRDALDFNLFFGIRDNLQENGLVNDWRNIKNLSIDAQDEGFANNGSQGVAFAISHDDGPAHLDNVAQAYLMMRPGNLNVYMNGHQFAFYSEVGGETVDLRAFPKAGREDALGGLHGDTITALVNIRNTHGRGNYNDRTPTADEKELLIYEREKSALVVLNNRGDAGFDARTVQTSFDPGTPLIELTGNADNTFIDPNDDLASVLIVKPDGTVDLRAPRNKSIDGAVTNDHRSGYLIYGVSGPQGQLRLTDTGGQDLTNILAGSTPVTGEGGANDPFDSGINGKTRLADITVVTDDSFKLRLETTAVYHAGGTIRDLHADSDQAKFRIDAGIDANGNSVVDHVTPGDILYGFEGFLDANSPGYGSGQLPDGGGDGFYEQTIDTTQLAEGRHYITGRAFRHRLTGTGGDGGPAVFTDFRKVIYVDRLKPEAGVVSFDLFKTGGTPNSRELIVESLDGTAENMHLFLDLPANITDGQLLAIAQGQSASEQYDRNRWIVGINNLASGNHVTTIVTFEESGNWNIQRIAGLAADTNRGAGLGDLDFDSVFEVSDISGIELAIASNNSTFNPAADANADGLIDNLDLIAIGSDLVTGGASGAVLTEYSDALIRRADLDGSGQTTEADLALMYANLGSSDTLYDLNLDGTTDLADVQSLITDLVRTVAGDFNLDGEVNAADYTIWRDQLAEASPSLVADANLDGSVDALDYTAWAGAFGFARGAFTATSVAVPEPASWVILGLALGLTSTRRRTI